jgi:glutathione synthase/RimK-type ligase-like ATP-grasp enzyme
MQPILGILTVLQDPSSSRPFGEQTSLFQAIHHAAVERGMSVFLIHPQPIKMNNKLLSGYTLHEGSWLHVSGRFPDVIYNRIPTRALEQTREVQLFQSRLRKRTGGRIFNRTGFFSKLQTYSIFKDRVPKGLLLPMTMLAKESEQILQHASKWGELWLKPDGGSLGRGIYRILREPFGYTIESSDEASTDHFDNYELLSKMSGLLSNTPYLIQQGIKRAEHQLRPFDIRVVLHRNGMGKFEVTNTFARLADHGQIVTNVMAGGEGVTLKELLTVDEQRSLRTLSLACARQLSLALPGPIGELGIDIALDKDRQFWLIEANSKPRLKMAPDDPSTPAIAKRIVEYASFLMKHPPKHQASQNSTKTVRNNSTPLTSPTSRKPARREQKDR